MAEPMRAIDVETAARRKPRDGGARAVKPSSRHDAYEVLVDRREADIAARWNHHEHQATTTVFQTSRWLETWYATIGRVQGQPLLLTVADRRTGALAAMLPLILRTDSLSRIIEFADADYNAPALGPAAPIDVPDARLLWSAVCAALPDADFLRLDKMPSMVEGRVNPLALLPQARQSLTNCNVVAIDGGWSDYISTFERTFRKELERSWRVFLRHDGATFRRIEDRAEAMIVFAELERQQSERLVGSGAGYNLDRPEMAEFYRKLVADGIGDGGVVLTALTCRGEVVAALLGVARGATYVMIRICSGSKEWSNCSPGRLVITQTMQMLHAEGYRRFDFSIGDYAYKRRLGVSTRPLFRVATPLSARGLPMSAYECAKRFVKQRPAIYAQVRRLRNL